MAENRCEVSKKEIIIYDMRVFKVQEGGTSHKKCP